MADSQGCVALHATHSTVLAQTTSLSLSLCTRHMPPLSWCMARGNLTVHRMRHLQQPPLNSCRARQQAYPAAQANGHPSTSGLPARHTHMPTPHPYLRTSPHPLTALHARAQATRPHTLTPCTQPCTTAVNALKLLEPYTPMPFLKPPASWRWAVAVHASQAPAPSSPPRCPGAPHMTLHVCGPVMP
jgi:hypothetical protein